MLFIESRTASRQVEGEARLTLLEKLQEKGLTPVIRATRLSCYEQALLGQERVAQMERELAAWTEREDGSAYVRGDLFCFEDFVLFLIFGERDAGLEALRAGIIHEAETTEPRKKLDAFCRNVSEGLEALRGAGRAEAEGQQPSQDEGAVQWSERASRLFGAAGMARGFTVASEAAPVRAEARGEQARALEVLEEAGARRFLHRLREARSGGRLAELLSDEEREAGGSESLINRLSSVGLLRRELLVSCRKVGRPLFRLPSPEALNVITASSAICSECGASIADEKMEDFIKPTDEAAALLEDDSWLVKRAYSVLRGLGVAERHIAVAQANSEGEGHLLAQVCDELFLFVLMDGDLTLAHTRRVFDKQLETSAHHLVLVTTGVVHEEARVRLREQARRRSRGGEVEVILVEGLDTLAGEVDRAFERVSERAVCEELYELDSSLGLSAGHLVTTRFRLARNRPAALKDLAESAVDALAGSLREI